MAEQTQDVRGRIVVGVDGSDHSLLALRWAVKQAELTGYDVEAVACWQWPSSVGGFMSYEDFDLSAVTRGVVDAAIATVVGDGHTGVTFSATVVEGYPARALIEAAQGADLLVVGSRGHHALSGLLLGSVGLHCATHAPCPVLIVRHPDHGSSPE
ncbi:MAG: universal stress protein [Frankiales bacterium]|nr:universal stress protein [Frankiales bacterium]